MAGDWVLAVAAAVGCSQEGDESAISGFEIVFSSPSGISDSPVLVISAIWARRIVSWAPPPRRSVRLVAVSAAMIPAVRPAVLIDHQILNRVGGNIRIGVEDVGQERGGVARWRARQVRPQVESPLSDPVTGHALAFEDA